MPSWNDILDEVKKTGSTHDKIRRKYMLRLHKITKRNTIAYYSGWLQKDFIEQSGLSISIDDSDQNGFMTTIYKMDRTKGLDLVLHTPGGSLSATEALVTYLRAMFGTNIRAIVPHMAMSAGTMLSLSCKDIVMGKHSSLGPIDPQIGGISAHGIVEEVQRVIQEIQTNPATIAIWQPIISKYRPTLISDCEQAVNLSSEIVKKWLTENMLNGLPNSEIIANCIVDYLGNHSKTKMHSRHISAEELKTLGVKIINLESDQKLQEAVLSVHHSYIYTLTDTSAYKIIENHAGTAVISKSEAIIQ